MRPGYSNLVLPSLGSFALALAATCSAQSPGSSSGPVERFQPVISAIPAPAAPAKAGSLQQNYGRLPLSFEANRGQAAPRVRFIARGSGYSLFLTDSSAVLALSKAETTTSQPHAGAQKQPQVLGDAAKSRRTDVIRMQLVGARKDSRAQEEDELPGKMNYFIGRDPAKWHTGVPTYARIRYSAVYPGIGLVYYGNQSQLEYDFLVAPHADPRAIRLRFAGAQRLALTADGDLSISARDGEIAFHKPTVYQEIDGRRQPVDGRFELAGKTVGFALGAYNHSAPLIIDPVLGYSTYFSGSWFTAIQGIAVDGPGNAYFVGYSGSGDLPVTPGAYNTGGSGAFVTKLNAMGTALVYSTLLSGGGADTADGIAVDSSGDAFVTGATSGSDLPVTSGAFQTSLHGVANAFLTKLNPAGSALMFSTYLGGSVNDGATSVTIDSSGNSYVAGYAQSPDFPVTAGAFQAAKLSSSNYYSGFITKLNPTGTALVYSTFLGGSGGGPAGDVCQGIALDRSGNAYVAGYAGSSNFPVTAGSFQSVLHGTQNAIVAELNSAGTALLYSTYLGGSGSSGDAAFGIALDGDGNAYVAGQTGSSNFPTTPDAFQSTNNNPYGTAFAAKVNPTGTKLIYSTYLGGSGNSLSSASQTSNGDIAKGIAVNASGEAYLAGSTTSFDFPVTPGALQTTNATLAAFLTKLNAAGTGLIYSTYLGAGPYSNFYYPGDQAWALTLDASGNAYVAGLTQDSNFPVTSGAFQTSNVAGLNSGFITKFDLGSFASPNATITTLSASANPQSSGQWITFTATVAGADASTLPTGNVTFSVDGDAVPAVQLNAGEATWTTYSLAKGSHIIEAAYSGSSTFSSSTSNSLKEAIVPPPTGESTLPAPMFSPNPGKYTGSVPLMLADTNPNAQIYYTVGGSAPALYAGPIALQPGYTTVEAFASAAGYDPSPIARASYTVIAEAPTPVFSPGSGSYAPGQEVAISDADPTATIRYTTDGSMPTTRSTLYTRTLVLTGTETIRAIAVATGDAASTVASATYTPE